jgi:acetate---CoA ligase (ADP-forming)
VSSDLDVLRPLFCPHSIAVVGASSGPKAGGAMVRSLLGFPGALHFVNRRGSEVEGRPALTTVAAIGEPVDLAMLVVPASSIPDTLEDCGRAGVKAVVICASGFAESDGGGSLQDQVIDIAARRRIRVLGPNTVGFVNPVDGVRANFVTNVRTLKPGSLSIVASSGGVSLAAAFLAAEEDLGLRLTVGLGNAADIGFSDVLAFLREDAATSVIALHLEGVDDGRGLFDAVAA